MIILWIRKSKKDKDNQGLKEEIQTFKEHNEVMKKFRMAHGELDAISDKDILTGNGNLLAPVLKVRLSDHTQN